MWPLLSGTFGLLFGALRARLYAFMVCWWIIGIPFDLLHAAGNFAIALVLFCPPRDLLGRLYGQVNRR